MHLITCFFIGAFLCNCVPHLCSGMQGHPFPSPFAKPPGKGNSSPTVNVLWGSFNLAAGLALLAWHPVALAFSPALVVLLAGALMMGLLAARQFGTVMADRAKH